MSVITFTTDFGKRDFHFAQIRGIVSSSNLDVELIEVTHEIEPFNNFEAAYVVKNSFYYFPENSIHIISVGVQAYERFLLAKYNGHYFITADNGTLSLIFDEWENADFYSIKNQNLDHCTIFPTRDYFIQAALDLAIGKTVDSIGSQIFDAKKIYALQPIQKGNNMSGVVVYIDSYGNAITNIKKEDLLQWLGENKFTVYVRNDEFNKIYNCYSGVVLDVERESKYHGKGMVLFNSAGYLEIAIYKSNPNSFGSAKSLYNLKYGDTVLIVKYIE